MNTEYTGLLKKKQKNTQTDEWVQNTFRIHLEKARETAVLLSIAYGLSHTALQYYWLAVTLSLCNASGLVV